MGISTATLPTGRVNESTDANSHVLTRSKQPATARRLLVDARTGVLALILVAHALEVDIEDLVIGNLRAARPEGGNRVDMVENQASQGELVVLLKLLVPAVQRGHGHSCATT